MRTTWTSWQDPVEYDEVGGGAHWYSPFLTYRKTHGGSDHRYYARKQVLIYFQKEMPSS